MNMTLKTGHFNIFSILEFASNHSVMPGDKNEIHADLLKKYSTLIDTNVIANVPKDKPGWYLWGRFNEMGWWETIYLGKAGKQKTSSLHNRLHTELRDDNIAFWAEIYGREPMIKQLRKVRRREWKPDGLRKYGSRFVIWVGVEDSISEEEINRQERILIKLYRPTHNINRWEPDKPDSLTEAVEKAIENEQKRILENTIIE